MVPDFSDRGHCAYIFSAHDMSPVPHSASDSHSALIDNDSVKFPVVFLDFVGLSLSLKIFEPSSAREFIPTKNPYPPTSMFRLIPVMFCVFVVSWQFLTPLIILVFQPNDEGKHQITKTGPRENT